MRILIKIKGIEINAFRGIPELQLNLDGRNLLIKGGNGTGKSSIVDAIEFFFRGKVSHLEGVQSLSLVKHGPHKNFGPEDIDIKVEFNPGNILLNRTYDSEPTPPPEFEQYFRVAQEGVFTLRRAKVLEFINSQPRERSRAIGNIIGVEALDSVELNMKRLWEDLESKIENFKDGIKELLEEISKLLGTDINELGDILTPLNRTLAKQNLPPVSSFEKMNKHARNLWSSIREKEAITEYGNMRHILSSVGTVTIDENIIQKINEFNEKKIELKEKNAHIELAIVDLLNIGQDVIDRENMDVCPLCQQKINRKEVLGQIKQRLELMSELSEEKSAIERTSKSITHKIFRLIENIRGLIDKIESIRELGEEKKILEKGLVDLNEFIEKTNLAKDFKGEITTDEFKGITNNIVAIFSAISVKARDFMRKIYLTEKEHEAFEIIVLLREVNNLVSKIIV